MTIKQIATICYFGLLLVHSWWLLYYILYKEYNCSCQGSTNTSCFLSHVLGVSAHRLGMGNYQLQALLLWILCSTCRPLQVDWNSISKICSYNHIWALHVKQGIWKMLKCRNESTKLEVWKYGNTETEVQKWEEKPPIGI